MRELYIELHENLQTLPIEKHKIYRQARKPWVTPELMPKINIKNGLLQNFIKGKKWKN